MEGSPSYGLTHQLTVGSEVGNIVIADPSVSPRHCTFVLQDEVVSVIDHGSVAGTLINDQSIPPGRYIILEESDSIKVGDLEVKILTENEAVKEEILEDVYFDEEVGQHITNKKFEFEEYKPPPPPKEKKPGFFARYLAKKKEKKAQRAESAEKNSKPKGQKQAVASGKHSTNSFVRLIAVICDFLIAYIINVIFYPFDEFRSIIQDIPKLIGEAVGYDFTALATMLKAENPFISQMSQDLYKLFSGTFNFIPIIILFIAIRLLTTFIFSVSISEAFLGVRSRGDSTWKRFRGVARVVVGIFTGPLLIFDLPALVSRRTFKEFVTFTHTYLKSTFAAILGTILYFPLLIALAILSPLIQGLELPEPIAINDKIDVRVKIAPTEGASQAVKIKDSSKFFNLELEFEPENLSILPQFKFSGRKQKLNYKPVIVAHHKDLQRNVQVELYKTFDFRELLNIAIKGDYFLQEKFPAIDGFVNASELSKTAFKSANDEKANQKFAEEVVTLTKIAFGISAINAFENMQEYTPFLKGLMDYRLSFLSLWEYKEFSSIDFIKLGNAYFLRIAYDRQKPFDLIIPLIKGEGRIFKVEFDSKERLGELRNKFYKFSMNDSNWFPVKSSTASAEVLGPLQVLDFFSQEDLRNNVPADKAQALYGYYFEKSAEVLRNENPQEMAVLKKSVGNVFSILDTVQSTREQPASPEEGVEDTQSKLYQNFKDLKDALENRNKEFFGIETTTTI